jgi:hypothetical protein
VAGYVGIDWAYEKHDVVLRSVDDPTKSEHQIIKSEINASCSFSSSIFRFSFADALRRQLDRLIYGVDVAGQDNPQSPRSRRCLPYPQPRSAFEQISLEGSEARHN